MQQAISLMLVKDGTDVVRVGVAPNALDQYPAGPSREHLLEAAVQAFRARATRAGYPEELIESEVERFREQIG